MRIFKGILALGLVLCLMCPAIAMADTMALEALTGITSAQAETKYTALQKGSHGDVVKAIQQKLINLGYLNDKADGSFGNMTKSAVELFETEQELNVDGILEPLEIYYLLDCDPLSRTEVIISKASADDPASIDAALNALPLRVTNARILVQSKLNKDTYPDMLTAVVYNESKKTVTSYTVGFLGYDENGAPMQILTQYDENGYFELLGDAIDITMPSGSSFGSSYGWRLREGHGLSTILACVESATFEDGTVWQNPVYSVWIDAYAEKALK